MKSNKEENRCIAIILVDTFFVLVTLYTLCITGPNLIPEYSWDLGTDHFMDFFNHIGYCQKLSETYYVNYNACFPPFAYLFYKFLNVIMPGKVVLFQSSQISPAGLLVYVFYSVIIFSLIHYVTSKIIKKSSCSICLFLLFLLSYPVVFGIVERGNASGLVLLFLLNAISLKDSDSKLEREIALIMIAMAAGFKVYPAVFGFLYVIEKRYKESIRLLIYGVVIFFLPFVLLGGFNGFWQFIDNQITLHNGDIRGDNWTCISVMGVLKTIFRHHDVNMIGTFIMILLLLLCVFTFINTKSDWKRVAILVSVMILIPKWSSNYVLAYLFLPLVMYVKEKGPFKPIDCLYSGIFAITNSLLLLPKSWNGIFIGEWLPIIGAYMLPLVIFGETVGDMVSAKANLANDTIY